MIRNNVILMCLILMLAAVSVNAAVLVSDHPSPFDVLTAPDFATGNAPSGSTGRFGFDVGETYGQSFTLDSAITLDSIYAGYSGYNDSSTVTLTIDAGNNGTVDYTFAGLVVPGTVHAGGNDGPFSHTQFDLSAEGIVLPPGQHAWSLEMTAEDGDSWAYAPSRNTGDTYAGGTATGVTSSGDNLFAVTGAIDTSIPATAVNVAPADAASDVPAGALNLDWNSGDDPGGATLGYLVTCEQTTWDGTVTLLADTVDVAVATTELGITVVSDASYTWDVDTYYGTYPTDPNDIVRGATWAFDTELTRPQITPLADSMKIGPGWTIRLDIEATDPLSDDPAEINPATLSYQWIFDPNTTIPGDEIALADGGRVSGATSPNLAITDAGQADMGPYYCDVTNAATTVSSNTVTLVLGKLLAHYTFDGNANDSSANANDGTWGGTEAYDTTNPIVGSGAASFDGDSYVDLGTKGAPCPELGGQVVGTVCFWAKTTDKLGAITGSFNLADNTGWQIEYKGSVNFYIRAGSWNRRNFGSLSVDLWDGLWHFVVLAYDGSATSLYIDGQIEATQGGIGLAANSFTPFEYPMLIGARSNRATPDEKFTGAIDDYRVYDFALNAENAAAAYYDVTGLASCVNPPALDYNDDCKVDMDDLAIFIASWLECGILPDCIQ